MDFYSVFSLIPDCLLYFTTNLKSLTPADKSNISLRLCSEPSSGTVCVSEEQRSLNLVKPWTSGRSTAAASHTVCSGCSGADVVLQVGSYQSRSRPSRVQCSQGCLETEEKTAAPGSQEHTTWRPKRGPETSGTVRHPWPSKHQISSTYGL